MAHLNPQQFEIEKKKRVLDYPKDLLFIDQANAFMIECIHKKHSYNFSWLGLPIIQFPDDIMAMQELIFSVKPDVIIETGVARGGSLLFYASLLKLIDKKIVIGIDVLILDFNREGIQNHFLADKIRLVEGDSTSESTLSIVRNELEQGDKVIVCLDSNHSQQHVYKELLLYSNLVPVGSYIVVFDSTVENFAESQINQLKDQYHIKDWEKGNNPGSAVIKFLKEDSRFELDDFLNSRALVSNCRGGFLKRIS